MKVSSKYSIKFPTGHTIIMTLKSIHFAAANHKVKYVFVDDSGTVVKFTRGVCKKVVIQEHFPFTVGVDDLYH